MTWRPSPQPPCPCGNCNQPPPETVTERKCTEEDPCSFCGPVKRFWSLDPAPVEEPPIHEPEPEFGLIRSPKDPLFVSLGEIDYSAPTRPPHTDLIRDATNRKAS